MLDCSYNTVTLADKQRIKRELYFSARLLNISFSINTRPGAACVTGGHKSPVSLPPPGPCIVWKNTTQLYSVLLNKKAVIKNWRPHGSPQTLTTYFFLCVPSYFNVLHFTIVLITQSNSRMFPRDHSLPQEKDQIYSTAPSQALAKQSLVAHPLVRGFSQTAVMNDSSHSSLLWQKWVCCSTKDPAAHCLICSTDDMQSVRKEPIYTTIPGYYRGIRGFQMVIQGLLGAPSTLKDWTRIFLVVYFNSNQRLTCMFPIVNSSKGILRG